MNNEELKKLEIKNLKRVPFYFWIGFIINVLILLFGMLNFTVAIIVNHETVKNYLEQKP